MVRKVLMAKVSGGRLRGCLGQQWDDGGGRMRDNAVGKNGEPKAHM